MSSTTSRRFLRPAALIGAAVLAASVTACGSAGTPSAATPASASAPASALASAAAGVLTVRDPWVKAADKGMTAAFATLANDGDTDVTITGVTTGVSRAEIHEMAMTDGKMAMRQKQGGVVVAARSQAALEPGGDHLMLMDLTRPVRAGDQLDITLTFADGRTQTFTAVAKPFTGAQESYAPGHGASPAS
ncbi:copper chaperone PCu(A)C [Micromonospora aurantiaca (nom. illeg.)]|uniref:copper chaperone PCu(A)C n=1 Tax=Micromonospora aurantiaca (nom. illeg.) TaxID=47850 RepID=UPI0033DDF456